MRRLQHPANIGNYTTGEIYNADSSASLSGNLLHRARMITAPCRHAEFLSSYVTFRAAERPDSPRNHLGSYLLAIAIFDNFANNRPRINCQHLSNDSSGLDAAPPTVCNDPARRLPILHYDPCIYILRNCADCCLPPCTYEDTFR